MFFFHIFPAFLLLLPLRGPVQAIRNGNWGLFYKVIEILSLSPLALVHSATYDEMREGRNLSLSLSLPGLIAQLRKSYR